MTNWCSTNLRQPTEKELEEIRQWEIKNPQQPNETDEDYIMRYVNSHSVFDKILGEKSNE